MTLLRRDRRPHAWKPGRDFRIICDCQKHARSRSRWRRAVRLGTHTLALLVGVPAAFSLLERPMKAMNLDVGSLRIRVRAERAEPPRSPSLFPIFTSDRVRTQFLAPPSPHTWTMDVVKEQYFRAEVPYGDIIYREAKRNRLSPELVAAVIDAESDFRPHLVSHKNAQGLMQIVPDTSRILGIANPLDPEENIAAGTRYLRYLFDRFDDQSLALAAYNAGEGNVMKWVGVPPFTETLTYLDRVGARSRQYRQRVHNTYVASVRTARAAQ